MDDVDEDDDDVPSRLTMGIGRGWRGVRRGEPRRNNLGVNAGLEDLTEGESPEGLSVRSVNASVVASH